MCQNSTTAVWAAGRVCRHVALREELGFAAGHTWSGILALISVCFRFFLFTMGTMINVLPIPPRFVEKRSNWESIY